MQDGSFFVSSCIGSNMFLQLFFHGQETEQGADGKDQVQVLWRDIRAEVIDGFDTDNRDGKTDGVGDG